jgi:hypothetical protein
MPNAETTFNDLGVSAILGTQLLGWLNLSLEDLAIPSRFTKLQGCIDYLKQFPDDTQRFLINKATRGKAVDKLDHLYEYTNLLKEKTSIEANLKANASELSVISGSQDMMKISELTSKVDSLQTNLRHINEEITIYEK